MNKAQRLEVAGHIAPSLREQALLARGRRVAVIDASGNVVAYVSLADVQAGVLKRAAIELDVANSVRPELIFCKDCGVPVLVKAGRKRASKIPSKCLRCKLGSCVDCGALLSSGAKYMNAVRCRVCAGTAPKPRTQCADCGKPTYQASVRCKPCNTARITVPRPQCATCGKTLSNPRATHCKRHASKKRRVT